MEWVTTSTILQRLCDFDDQEMWSRFHERFRRPVLQFVRRMGFSDAAAEDVTQETLIAFMEAYRNQKYERAKGRLSSWLFGITYRQAANARRKHFREEEHRIAVRPDESFWSKLPDESAAEKIWDKEWEETVLEGALAQVEREVNAKTFQAFFAIVRQGRSSDEVAKELGMTRDAVYVAKHRVLKRLSDLIKDHEQME